MIRAIKNITFLCLAVLAIACKTEPKVPAQDAEITIWEVHPDAYSVSFRLTVSEAVSCRYAVELKSSVSPPDWKDVDVSKTEVLFEEGLTPGKECLILAEAQNGDGKTFKAEYPFTSSDAPSVVLENVEAFYNIIKCNIVTTNCVKIRYAFGKSSLAEPAPEAYTETSTSGSVPVSFDGLTESTEYSVYVYPITAQGVAGELFKGQISTTENIIVITLLSKDEQTSYVKYKLGLGGVSTLYYTYSEEGTSDPAPEDYASMVIPSGQTEAEVEMSGLKVGHSYAAFFYGENPGRKGDVVKDSFVSKDNSINLTAEATANSYICNELTDYKFNAAVKGCSSESIGTPVSVEILWTTEADMMEGLDLDGTLIRFSLKKHGNAYLAAKDASGKVLWSWLIYSPEEPIADEVINNYYGASYYVMNRNFGAMKSREGADCLLYQWGRKDPFPNTHGCFVAGTGSSIKVVDQWPPVEYSDAGTTNEDVVAWSIAHPAVFISSQGTVEENYQAWTVTPDFTLWGDRQGYIAQYQNGGWSADKSIYDPCPPGYRVANLYTVSGFTTTGANSENVSEFNVLNASWGSGASGYWLFKRTATDTEGTYWPNTASRNPKTGVLERGTQAEHWFSQATGNTGAKARYSQIFATRVFVKTSSCQTAYGHALRCVRYKSETERDQSK